MLRLLGRFLGIVIILLLAYQLWLLGHVVYWVYNNPNMTAFMAERLELLQERKPGTTLRHQWVPYERISPHLKRALVAAEDARFLEHEGFDWEGIEHALEKNLKQGKIVAGGSTISQQLAKNLFLSTAKTPWRKGQEAIITVMLEQVMSKRRILEIYANVIEWGDRVYGAEAAARHYYGTSASRLSAYQAARLASMVPNPRYYARHPRSRALERKTRIIQARMRQVTLPP